jgi:hypothetical protein
LEEFTGRTFTSSIVTKPSNGVFDAEFLEVGGRKLLIDIKPRCHNHMAFENERGLHLPWMTYLAASGNFETLKIEIAKSKSAPMSRLRLCS